MKKINTAKLVFALLGTLTAACTAGSIGSTLAWYAYSTRALVAYSGTSVNGTVSLQIGIASLGRVSNMPSTVTETRFLDDARYYYFAEPGKGLTYDVISTYLAAKEYATNELAPTTSGSYTNFDTQSSFSLKNAPSQIVHGNTVTAEKKNYLTIPFVFRVAQETASGRTYLEDKELWLTHATAQAASSTDGQIYRGIRVFVDRDDDVYGAGNDFIFNPSATAKGKTKVGGLLELTRDGYYDYDNDGEILYGEYDAAALALKSTTGYNGQNILHDVNGSGNSTRASTFTAKHHKNTLYYDDLSSQANSALFKTAEYESLSSIAPARDQYDNLSNADANNPTSVCKTGGPSKIARVDMTVYLEGWDFSVIDEEQRHSFDLGLTFEISRV